jgi:hypothetical protein
MSQIDQLKTRLLNKNSLNKSPFKAIIAMHELFIKEYGWVPLEEFRQIPAETFFNLMEAAYDRIQKEKKKIKKPRRR